MDKRELKKCFCNCTSESCIEENFNRVLDMYGYEELKEVSATNDIEEGCVFLENFPAFVVGDTVSVKVGGKEFSLVAYYDGEYTIIGDKYSDIERNLGEHGSWQIDYYDGEAWFYSSYPYTVTYDIHADYHPISKDFLPDGYPYETKSYITIAEEQSATHKKTFLLSSVDGYYNNKGYLDGTKIIAGNTYIVYVDGVAYEGVAYEGVTESGYTRLCIFGPDNDIFPNAPINIVIGAGTRGTTCAVYFSDGGTHNVKVDLCERTLEKLDPKFLPEGYPYMGEGEIALKYDSSKYTTLTLQGFPSFEVGDTVSIKVDGIGHSLEAFLESINGFDYIFIGDSSYELENKTGEYGWQVYVPPEEELILFRSSGIHTVSWNVPKAYPIDPKFLPEGIGGGGILAVTIVWYGGDYTCNKTYEEIKNALFNNIPVFATISIRTSENYPRQCSYGSVKFEDDESAIHFSDGYSELKLKSDNIIYTAGPM